MPSLPSLTHWDSTRLGLHRAAQVLGGVRGAVAAPEPNWLHLSMKVISEGVTTGPIVSIGELVLDFNDSAVIYRANDREAARLGLKGHHQLSLADVVEQMLASQGHEVAIDHSKITSDEPFEINSPLAKDFAVALHRIASTLEQFRETLPNEKTPVVNWPHGFDTSCLWFATDKTTEEAPHLSFGFSPGSAGFDRPYIYAYAWPRLEGLTEIPLPAPARWYSGSWTGMAVDYDQFAEDENPEEVILKTLQGFFDNVAVRLK